MDVAGFARGPTAAAAAASLRAAGWPLAGSAALSTAELHGDTACTALGLLHALDAMEGCAVVAAAAASALRGGGSAAGKGGRAIDSALDDAPAEQFQTAQAGGRVWARQAAAPVMEEAFLEMLDVGAGSWDDPADRGSAAAAETLSAEPSRLLGGKDHRNAGAAGAAGAAAASPPQAARVGWDAVDDVIDWEDDVEGPASLSSSDGGHSSPTPTGHSQAPAGPKGESGDPADNAFTGAVGVAATVDSLPPSPVSEPDAEAEPPGEEGPFAAGQRARLEGGVGIAGQLQHAPGALLRPDRPDLLCRALRAVAVGCLRRALQCARRDSASALGLSEASCSQAAECMLVTLLEWAGRVLADAAVASAGIGTASSVVAAHLVSLACECELMLGRDLPPLLLAQCAHAEEASHKALEMEGDTAAGELPAADGLGATASASAPAREAAAGWQSGLARRRMTAPPCVRAAVAPLWADLDARGAWLDAELKGAAGGILSAVQAFPSLSKDKATVGWEPAKPLRPGCERQCAAAAGALAARRARQLAALLPGPAARSGVMREFAATIADLLCSDAARAVSAVHRAADSRSAAEPWVLAAGAVRAAGGAGLGALPDPFEECRPSPSRPPHLRLPTAIVDGVCLAGVCRAAVSELRAPVVGADPAATAPACRKLLTSADALERAIGEAVGGAAARLARLTVAEAAAARLRLRPQTQQPSGRRDAGGAAAAAAASTAGQTKPDAAQGGDDLVSHGGRVSGAALLAIGVSLRRLPPKPRRSVLSALSPVEALATVAEAATLTEETQVPPPAACARRAVMLAAMLAAGSAVDRALLGPSGAVRAAHLAVSAAAAALGPLATSPSAPIMRVAGCLRLLSVPPTLERLADALRLAVPALLANDPVELARGSAEGAAARVGRAWASSTAPGTAGAAFEVRALATTLWGRAQGAEARAARELLEAYGLAGCSPEEVVALQAMLAE